ncbi:MAG TPA: efflux RND transporter periplasmic adaptor subunit [Polyangiales bacterium]|nr:efflux RND transporter periplasmic adaptor subunit [Polyangiales bacterium]
MRANLKTAAWIGAAIVLGSTVYGTLPWKIGAGASNKPPPYQTSTIDRGPIVAKVTASGTLSALVTVQVGSQVSGRIREIFVDFNSVVKKGEVIARLDTQLLTATLEQARANFDAAQADLLRAQVQARDAERQLGRQRSLHEQKLTAQADFDTAQANSEVAAASVAAAQGRLAQTRAALHQAQVNLNYATIESPIDGVVISRSVDVGQTVTASLQTPTLFVIAEDLRKMQVDTSVAEADVGRLQAGMRAYFTVDAFPNDRFEGTVRQIRNAATTVQNVVTYDAVIDVANPELKLRPGMTANVTFVYADQQEALRTVNAALRFKPSAELLKAAKPPETGGKPGSPEAAPEASGGPAKPRGSARGRREPTNTGRTLWVLRGQTPQPVNVKLGITDGTHTEIVEGGLREGDLVITDVVGGSDSGGSPRSGGPGRPGGFRRIL